MAAARQAFEKLAPRRQREGEQRAVEGALAAKIAWHDESVT
jgi:hypothetical protein